MDYLPALSHGADQLAFVSKRSGFSQIWILDIATGALNALEPPDRGRRFHDLKWSNDDRQLLANTNSGILVYDLDNDVVSRAVAFEYPAQAVSWFDEQSLLLSHYEDQRWQVYRHDLETGQSAALDPRWAAVLRNEEQVVWIDQDMNAYRDGVLLPELAQCAAPIWRDQLRWQLDGANLTCHAADAFTDLLQFDADMNATRLPGAVNRYEFFSVRGDKLATTSVSSAQSDIMRTTF